MCTLENKNIPRRVVRTGAGPTDWHYEFPVVCPECGVKLMPAFSKYFKHETEWDRAKDRFNTYLHQEYYAGRRWPLELTLSEDREWTYDKIMSEFGDSVSVSN